MSPGAPRLMMKSHTRCCNRAVYCKAMSFLDRPSRPTVKPEAFDESPLRRLISQLRERKLVQWAIAYTAGAWLLLQVVDTVGTRWGMTESVSRMFDVVLVVGLLVALVLAWYHGEQGRQRVGAVELLILGALLFLGGIGLRMVEVSDEVDAETSTVTSPMPPAATTDSDTAPMTPPAERRRTIAVLPFDNFSPSSDDAYFAAGITEEITGQLARIGDLTVLSRTAVEQAMESAEASGASLADMAASLGAGALLEGSVRMAGQRVRITAQLIDVASQGNLWSDNFDRELNDIFQIQTDVALAIGNALLAQLSSGERQRIEAVATSSIRAYQLYLRANRLWGNLPDTNQTAIGLLEQALALDPDFAEARASLSWRHTWENRLTGDRAEAERAEQLALQALASDPQLSFGYFALANALTELERMEEAQDAFDRMVELDIQANGLEDASFHYGRQGNPEKGLRLAFQAVRLAPNDANTRWHAYIPLLFLGDHDRTHAWLQLARDEGLVSHRLAAAEAELALFRKETEHAAALARAMLERFPDNYEAGLMAHQVLFLSGNVAEVSDALLAEGSSMPDAWSMPQLAPRSRRTIMGYVLAQQGEGEAAQRAFDASLAAAATAVARGSTHQGRALDVASIHAFRGDHEIALDALKRAFELGYRGNFLLAVDPFFATLRADSRFQALLERMAESQREQQALALRTGSLEGFDALIAAGAVVTLIDAGKYGR
jgi:TolB-like protein